jgi:2-dehydropantoate 2-reductase
MIGGGRGDKMPSFHIDLHSGKGLCEVDHLNGAVVKAGMELNLTTPVNSLFSDILSRLLDGSESLEKYDHKPQVLLSDLVVL